MQNLKAGGAGVHRPGHCPKPADQRWSRGGGSDLRERQWGQHWAGQGSVCPHCPATSLLAQVHRVHRTWPRKGLSGYPGAALSMEKDASKPTLTAKRESQSREYLCLCGLMGCPCPQSPGVKLGPVGGPSLPVGVRSYCASPWPTYVLPWGSPRPGPHPSSHGAALESVINACSLTLTFLTLWAPHPVHPPAPEVASCCLLAADPGQGRARWAGAVPGWRSAACLGPC